MNNLSKELCEICGIEPEISCANCSHPCEAACNNCNYGELIYPDFEQAENFVKLFELNISDSSVTVGAATCFCNRRHLNNRDDFLESVIKLAKYNNNIKQAIQKTEWVYE